MSSRSSALPRRRSVTGSTAEQAVGRSTVDSSWLRHRTCSGSRCAGTPTPDGRSHGSLGLRLARLRRGRDAMTTTASLAHLTPQRIQPLSRSRWTRGMTVPVQPAEGIPPTTAQDRTAQATSAVRTMRRWASPRIGSTGGSHATPYGAESPIHRPAVRTSTKASAAPRRRYRGNPSGRPPAPAAAAPRPAPPAGGVDDDRARGRAARRAAPAARPRDRRRPASDASRRVPAAAAAIRRSSVAGTGSTAAPAERRQRPAPVGVPARRQRRSPARASSSSARRADRDVVRHRSPATVRADQHAPRQRAPRASTRPPAGRSRTTAAAVQPDQPGRGRRRRRPRHRGRRSRQPRRRGTSRSASVSRRGRCRRQVERHADRPRPAGQRRRRRTARTRR